MKKLILFLNLTVFTLFSQASYASEPIYKTANTIFSMASSLTDQLTQGDKAEEWQDLSDYQDDLNRRYGPATRVVVNPEEKLIEVFLNFKIYAGNQDVADLARSQLQESIYEIWNNESQYYQLLCYRVEFHIENLEVEVISSFDKESYDKIFQNTIDNYHSIIAVGSDVGYFRIYDSEYYDDLVESRNIWQEIYSTPTGQLLPKGCGYYGKNLTFDSRCYNALIGYLRPKRNLVAYNAKNSHLHRINSKGLARPQAIVYSPYLESGQGLNVLSHEIGHVLGSAHINSRDNVMTKNASANRFILQASLGLIFENMDIKCSWDMKFEGMTYSSRQNFNGEPCGRTYNGVNQKHFDWFEEADLDLSFKGGYHVRDNKIVVDINNDGGQNIHSRNSARLLIGQFYYNEFLSGDISSVSCTDSTRTGIYSLNLISEDIYPGQTTYYLSFGKVIDAREAPICLYTFEDDTSLIASSAYQGSHMQNAFLKVFSAPYDRPDLFTHDSVAGLFFVTDNAFDTNQIEDLYQGDDLHAEFDSTYYLGESGMNWDCLNPAETGKRFDDEYNILTPLGKVSASNPYGNVFYLPKPSFRSRGVQPE